VCLWIRNNNAIKVLGLLEDPRSMRAVLGNQEQGSQGILGKPQPQPQSLGISLGTGMSQGPGQDAGPLMKVRIKPGEGDQGPLTQDGLSGQWRWEQGWTKARLG